MKNFVINKTVKIFSLNNSHKKIETFLDGYKNILVITNSKSYQKIKKIFYFRKSKKKIYFFIENSGEPSVENLDLSFQKIKKSNYDLIFVFGGGSIIDASKIISCSLKQKKPPSVIIKNKIQSSFLPIIAVPTVPGSSSEVNGSAVIKLGKTKVDINGIFPKIAILDANLIESLNKKILFGGLSDAFSHLCEHYFNSESYCDLVGQWTDGLFKGLIGVQKKLKKINLIWSYFRIFYL